MLAHHWPGGPLRRAPRTCFHPTCSHLSFLQFLTGRVGGLGAVGWQRVQQTDISFLPVPAKPEVQLCLPIYFTYFCTHLIAGLTALPGTVLLVVWLLYLSTNRLSGHSSPTMHYYTLVWPGR